VSRTIHTLLVLTSILLVGSGCKGRGEGGGQARPGAHSLPVRTAVIKGRDVVYQVKALGTLEAEELVQITAEVSGAVKEVLFHAGDRVSPDTVLARIDPDRYRLESQRAAANYRKAVADWKRAQADAERREALATDQLVAVEELNRARLEAERLEADAASSKASWEIAEQAERRSQVRAPRGGEISTRSVDTGQFVQVGNVLATLVDLKRLRLRFKVSDSESLKSKEGQAVAFKVASLGDAEFTARVYHVGDVADPGTRQVEILAWVDNPGVLKPGFFAEVTLATETHAGAVVVPEGAVQASERGFVVYVVDGGKAVERPVTLGLRTGEGAVEILSGAKPGDVIVTEGSDRLTNGIAVQAVDADSPRPAGV
jgi:membrane fusion protein, multidrug efflux system